MTCIIHPNRKMPLFTHEWQDQLIALNEYDKEYVWSVYPDIRPGSSYWVCDSEGEFGGSYKGPTPEAAVAAAYEAVMGGGS